MMDFTSLVSLFKRKILFFAFLCFIANTGNSQQLRIDSLKQVLRKEKAYNNRLNLINDIFFAYLWTNLDSAMSYAELGLTLSKQSNNRYYEGVYLQNVSQALALLGNSQAAIKYAHQALRIAEELNNLPLTAKCYNALATTYEELRDHQEAIKYCRQSLSIAINTKDKRRIISESINMSMFFNHLNQLDSALNYSQEAYTLALEYGKWDVDMIGSILIRLGVIQGKLGNYEIGLAYLKKAVQSSLDYEDWIDYYESNFETGKIYLQLNQKDSCIKYFNLALEGAQKLKYKRGILEVATVLFKFYKEVNKDSTLRYLEIESSLKDSLFNEEKLRTAQNMLYNEKEYQKELENEKAVAQKERKENLQLIGITIFIFTLFIFLILLSKVQTNSKLVNYMGLISLLLLFEFVGLLLHPIIGSITHHNPVWMLLIMVCIAALLVPIHHRLEFWVTHKLFERNKKIETGSESQNPDHVDPPIVKENNNMENRSSEI